MPAAKKVTANPVALARREYHQVKQKPKTDDPGRYSKTPHEYGDILITGNKLGGALDRDILYWIERYTWGTNLSKTPGNVTRPEWAKLSISQFARLCGGVERKSIALRLAYLTRADVGIVEARDRAGCGVTTAKMYKLTPERWAAAPKYTAPTAETDEDDEPDEDQETTGIEAESGILAIQAAATVQPGAASKPQAMALRTLRNAPPVTVRMVYHSKCSIPLVFGTRTGHNGRIQVTVSQSEEKANDYSLAQPQFKTSFVDNERFSCFEPVINAITLDVWGKAADSDLIVRILKAAGEAPAEWFDRLARGRLQPRSPERRRKIAAEYSPGAILPLIAQDASDGHQKAKARDQLHAEPKHEYTADERRELDTRQAELDELEKLCQPCNSTGKRGSWHKGVFTQHNDQACEHCHGTGRKPERKAAAA